MNFLDALRAATIEVTAEGKIVYTLPTVVAPPIEPPIEPPVEFSTSGATLAGQAPLYTGTVVAVAPIEPPIEPPVIEPPPNDPATNAYFEYLVERPDTHKAYALRPRPGAPLGSPYYEKQLYEPKQGGYLAGSGPSSISYDTVADAARITIPAFYPLVDVALGEDMDAVTTTLTLSPEVDGRFEANRAVLLDDEILIVVGPRSLDRKSTPVKRAQFGTTAATHVAGRRMALSNNSVINQVRLPLNAPDGHSYLIIIDMLWTRTYVRSGLVNHKSLQIASWKTGAQWFEIQTRFGGPHGDAPNLAWDADTSVAAVTARSYAQHNRGVTDIEPLLPMAGPSYVIKPDRWTRFWFLVEANKEGDAAKFVDSTTLVSAVDAVTPSITIDHSGFVNNPFTTATETASATWKGRALRLDDEILTVVSGPAIGTTRTLTVVRGEYGTTPAAHAAGTSLRVVDDFASLWMADEDTEPVLQYDRVPMHLPTNHADPNIQGTIGQFWIEFNTSTSALTRPDRRDYVAFAKNVWVGQDVQDIAALLLKPSNLPPPTQYKTGWWSRLCRWLAHLLGLSRHDW